MIFYCQCFCELFDQVDLAADIPGETLNSWPNVGAMIAEMLTFFRGFLSGVFVGLCLAAGGLLLGMYWLLDTDKRLTPLSMGQRPASGGQGPVSVPENWPASLKTFLERSMEPDPDTDYLLPPVTLPKRKGNAAEPGSSTGTKANPSNSSNSKDTPSDSGTVYVSPTLDVSWANILLARFFLMLRESELYKQKTASKMNAKMNAKLQSNSFMVCSSLNASI